MSRKRKMRTIRQEPKWRTIERIASQIENSLAPDAKVEHDVMLPVLGSDGEKRQCDAVITYGKPPRQTIAIVEVQRRKSKPKVGEFDSWMQKMRDVGAQHLICVSALGYPRSIINKAKKIGPTVRLLTLSEIQEMSFINVAFPENTIGTVKRMFVAEPLGKIIISSMPKTPCNASDKRFGWNDLFERHSLNELINNQLKFYELNTWINKGLKIPERYTLEITLGSSQTNGILWLYSDTERFEVIRWALKVDVNIKTAKLPLMSFSYKEEEINGTLSWVGFSKGTFDGQEYEISFIFRYDENGRLQVFKKHNLDESSVNLILYHDKASADAANQIF